MAEQIAALLKGLRSDSRGNDRRREPRAGLRARVSVAAGTDAPRPARSGWMRDISRGGAGLLLNEPLEIGQVVALHVPLVGERAINVRCRVIHCQKVGSFHRVGVEFVRARGPLDSAIDAGLDEFEALAEYMRRLSEAVTG